MHRDRFLIGVVAAIAAICVAAVLVVSSGSGNRAPPQGEDSPVGVVYNFIQARSDDNQSQMESLLTAETREQLTRIEEERTSEGIVRPVSPLNESGARSRSGSRTVVREILREGQRAFVRVEHRNEGAVPPFGLGERTWSVEVETRLTADGWRLHTPGNVWLLRSIYADRAPFD